MSLKLHSAPGFVDDLTNENKQGWSDIIDAMMDTRNVNPRMTPQFYNQTKDQERNPKTAVVQWIGFPRQVRLRFPNDEERWEAADAERQVQDEYLEWSVKRNAEGKIIKIVFCNEGPEYFEYLAEVQPETLLSLYKDLNPGLDIQSDDLFDAEGKYNPVNKWNDSTTTGSIMHLIQINNTLAAQVDLGGRATVVRKRSDGTVIIDRDELIACSRYGNVNRNSDPEIGIAVNNAVRAGVSGYKATLDDPVGLYIHAVDWAGVSPPFGHGGDDPSTFWKWTRGKDGRYVRAEFEVPADKGYVLGDLTVNNRRLNFGAQIADLVHVALVARVSEWDGTIEPRFCSEPPPPPQAHAKGSVFSVPVGGLSIIDRIKSCPGRDD